MEKIKMKPLKERIREIMEFYGWAVYTFAMNHRIGNYTKNDFIKAMELKRTQALQAILTEIKEEFPKKKEHQGKVNNSRFNKKIDGWNAAIDEEEGRMERFLE